MPETLYDIIDSDLATYLVGKSITAISGNIIEVSDGTKLAIEDAADCCAWFSGEVKAFDFEDNVITGVTTLDRASGYTEAWSLQIFSAHKLIAEVNIEGDSTNGYYCHSVNMLVRKAVRDGD